MSVMGSSPVKDKKEKETRDKEREKPRVVKFVLDPSSRGDDDPDHSSGHNSSSNSSSSVVPISSFSNGSLQQGQGQGQGQAGSGSGSGSGAANSKPSGKGGSGGSSGGGGRGQQPHPHQRGSANGASDPFFESTGGSRSQKKAGGAGAPSWRLVLTQGGLLLLLCGAGLLFAGIAGPQPGAWLAQMYLGRDFYPLTAAVLRELATIPSAPPPSRTSKDGSGWSTSSAPMGVLPSQTSWQACIGS